MNLPGARAVFRVCWEEKRVKGSPSTRGKVLIRVPSHVTGGVNLILSPRMHVEQRSTTRARCRDRVWSRKSPRIHPALPVVRTNQFIECGNRTGPNICWKVNHHPISVRAAAHVTLKTHDTPGRALLLLSARFATDLHGGAPRVLGLPVVDPWHQSIRDDAPFGGEFFFRQSCALPALSTRETGLKGCLETHGPINNQNLIILPLRGNVIVHVAVYTHRTFLPFRSTPSVICWDCRWGGDQHEFRIPSLGGIEFF